MKLKHISAGMLLGFSLSGGAWVQASPPDQPLRWVSVDDLKVRVDAGPDAKVLGTLPRGAELILKAPAMDNSFCLIEGEGRYGYVACKYLSAEPVARRRAGQDGIDAAQRWVSGTAVTLRETPRGNANVLTRLSLNTIVKLLHEDAGGGYCEVQPTSGPSGYTACRYLVSTPVVLAHILGLRNAEQAPSPDYDPVRAFWLQPSWNALENYATYLKEQHANIPPQSPWPRDAALEKMKAHLALGLNGPKPQPYADWSELKRKAAQDMDLSTEIYRLQAQGKTVPDEIWKRKAPAQQTAGTLKNAIGISDEMHDVYNGGAERVIRLVRSLDFPSIKPSLFHSEADLAQPFASTEQASGRFSIVYRQLVTSRPKPKKNAEDQSGAGLYDMLAHIQVLVRPVQRVQLFRDGRLHAESSLVRTNEVL